MRVLITGATGFIGSHLAEELHRKAYRIRCLVRPTSNLVWIKHLPIEYIYGDFFDLELLKKSVYDVDYIYHAAGITKAKTKKEYFGGNHIATRNLLNAIAEVKPNLKRFVHVSTQAAVGPSTNGIAINEQTPFHPITAYGISKMEAEKECLKLMNAFPITIIRPPAVYGPRDKDVFEFFHTMNKGIQPMIGFKNKYVSLIYVKDLINGIILAGENPAAVGNTYFISSERFYTWKEIGNITARIMNRQVMRLRIPEWGMFTIAAFAECFSFFRKKPALLNWEKAKDIVQNAWTCDITKAKTDLGFRETFSLEEGIRATTEWYRAQGWLR